MIKIYTDGSAFGTSAEWFKVFGTDPKAYKQPGGWAALIYVPNQDRISLTGMQRETSNLIMEIRAVNEALEYCAEHWPEETVFLHTDCQCVVQVAAGTQEISSHNKALRAEWERFLQLDLTKVAFTLGRPAIGDSGVHTKAKRKAESMAQSVMEAERQRQAEVLALEEPAPETAPIPTL